MFELRPDPLSPAREMCLLNDDGQTWEQVAARLDDQRWRDRLEAAHGLMLDAADALGDLWPGAWREADDAFHLLTGRRSYGYGDSQQGHRPVTLALLVADPPAAGRRLTRAELATLLAADDPGVRAAALRAAAGVRAA